MSLRTTDVMLMVFLWSLTEVLSQNGWSVTYTTQSICALKGSTVNLSCSYSYPSGHKVKDTWWYTKYYKEKNESVFLNLMNDSDYTGHVRYHGDRMNTHMLTITDLRETDSALYRFRFITDQPGGTYTNFSGVLLSVTGLQVNVTTGYMAKKLTCSTTCTLTDNINTTYTWYKKNVASPKASGQGYNITNIRSEDSGEYYCEAENKYGRLSSSVVFVDIQWNNQPEAGMGAAIGVTVVVLVLILCLSGFLLFRKMASKTTSFKGTTKDTADNGQVGPGPLYDNVSSMNMTSTEEQRAETDNQEDLQYASVDFSTSNNQEVPLSSTNQKLDDVQYAAVNFNAPMLPPGNTCS
ncbi:hypothetical protein UPYG_G00060440 [Umbra pygmaea]|uniref:Ig-like domain-containing protein n=1 Tax=Umbra pygmaea TaxID=75934 RepID=A0ABD0X982_UMBPY